MDDNKGGGDSGASGQDRFLTKMEKIKVNMEHGNLNYSETANSDLGAVMGSANRYTVGCDPYDRLNWFQALLKKTGSFYRNRPKSSVGVFKWKEDGSVEFVKHCP